jgi:hypothetical protein
MSIPEDEWVTSLTAGVASASPFSEVLGSTLSLGTSLPSGTTVTSGEYPGGAKQMNLFFFSPATVCLCLGFVGSGGRRFCIKPLKGDAVTCGVQKHSSKFTPSDLHFYFRGQDSTAFCEPCYSESIVPEEYRENILTTTKTFDEWKQVFSDYLEYESQDNAVSAQATATKLIFPDPMKLALKTPKKPLGQVAQSLASDFVSIIPPEIEAIKEQAFLPSRSHWWVEDAEDSIMSSSLFAFLTKLRMLLVKFEDWLVEPLDTLAKRTRSVEDDLHTLKSHCSGLQSAVGHPVSIANQEFPDVWCAIEFLSSSTWILCRRFLPNFPRNLISFMTCVPC